MVLLILVWILAGIMAWAWYREGFTDSLRRTALVAGAVLVLVTAVFFWRLIG